MPITEEWLVGFADGEGCFTVTANRGVTGVHAGQRKAHVRFEINQSARDADIIDDIRAFFGFGRVDFQRVRDSPMRQWRVLRQSDLEALVDLFDRVPLCTIKRHDYAIWRRAVFAKARLRSGPAGHNGANADAWAELEALAAEMRSLRQQRRRALA